MLSNNSTNLWPLQGVFVLFSEKNRSFSSICGLGDALEAHPAQGIAFAEHEVVLEQPVFIAPLLLQRGQLVRGGAVFLQDGAAGVGPVGGPELTAKELEVGGLTQAEQLHHHRRDVVGGDGAEVDRPVGVVRPHEQGGLMEAGVGAGPAGVAAAGVDVVVGVDGVVVVAPEHEDDRLVHLREVVRQPAQHGVGVPDAGGKVFQRTHGAGLEARRGFGDFHPLVVGVVILIIIGVVLHGDGVEEDGGVGLGLHGLVLADDLVGHGVVGDEAGGPVVAAHLLDAVHLLEADEVVEAEVGVGRVAAPISGPEAVDRRRLIALRLEVAGQGEHGLRHVLLVGLAAAGQIGHRVARQGLELHVTGAAAEAGAVDPAIGAGLLQSVEVGRDVGVELEAVLFQLRDVPVGLVHHVEDGGLLHLFVCRGLGGIGAGPGRAGGVLFPCLHVVEDGVDGLLGVSLGLVDLQIRQVGEEAGDDAVVAVVAVLHPCVGQDAQRLGDGRLQKHAEDEGAGGRCAGRKARQTLHPRQLLTAPVEEEGADGQSQHHDAGDDHALLDVDARRGGHAGGLGHLHQVPREEGLTPELQDIKVHRGGQTAQQGRQEGGQRGEAGEPVHRHPDEEEQPPRQQVGFWVGKDVLHKGISAQGAAGDVLGEHQKQKGGHRRKQQPRPVQPEGRSTRMVCHKEVPFTSAFFLLFEAADSAPVLYYNHPASKIQP